MKRPGCLVQSGFFVFQPYLLGACGRTTGAAAFAVIGRKDHDCTNQNNQANEIPEAAAPKSVCLTPAGFPDAKAPFVSGLANALDISRAVMASRAPILQMVLSRIRAPRSDSGSERNHESAVQV